jgi:hypothetical protein
MIPGNEDVEVRGRQILSFLPDGPAAGVEVGVFRGELSTWLLDHKPDLDLYMVDNWRQAAEGSPYLLTRDPHSSMTQAEHDQCYEIARVAIIGKGNRAEIIRMDSVEAAKSCPDHSVDFVFLDGDHSYEGVTADLHAWTRKVKRGGFICGHDYANKWQARTRVKDAVDDFFGAVPTLGEDWVWMVRL